MRVETAIDFDRQARQLRRRYRLLDLDIDRLTSELRSGVRPQDERLQNMGGMAVFKARLRNSSARRGTRGGFRIIYRVMEDGTIILLLLIWSKTDTSDLPDSEIRRIANKYPRL